MHAHDSAERLDPRRRPAPLPARVQRAAERPDPTRPLTPEAMRGLQGVAGNGALARMVQRAGGDEQSAGNVQDWLTPQHWDPDNNALRAKAEKNRTKVRGQKPKSQKMDKGRSPDEVLKNVIPGLLKELQNSKGDQLEIFRGMDREEADAILRWAGKAPGQNPEESDKARADAWLENIPAESPMKAFRGSGIEALPTTGHFGDEKQARNYYGGREDKALLKFVLRPGAHKLLFSPQYLALGAEGVGSNSIRHSDKFKDAEPFKTTNPHEGGLKGHVGVKSENPTYKDEEGREYEEKAFSLAASEAGSKLLFQTFIADVVDVSDRA